jgi:hypothetical protein
MAKTGQVLQASKNILFYQLTYIRLKLYLFQYH